MFTDLDAMLPFAVRGRVAEVTGLAVAAEGLPVPLGPLCRVGGRGVLAEAVAFRGDRTVLFPYGELAGVRSGDAVELARSGASVRLGEGLLAPPR